MSDFDTVRKFLDENHVTAKDMDTMWAYMYDKNFIVRNLTNHGKGWSDLYPSQMKSLIEQYSKAGTEVGDA